MTLAEHLQIDGQHQRAAFCCHGAFDQGFGEAAILHHIVWNQNGFSTAPATSSIEQTDMVDSV